MSKLVHLFYPIDDDDMSTKDVSFEDIEEKHKSSDKASYFSTVVVIELLQDFVPGERRLGRGCRKAKFATPTVSDLLSAENVWSKLQIDDDSVEEKRLCSDDDTYRQRAIVTYFSPVEARAAVSKYHRTKEYPKTCAFVAADVIANIVALERVINESDTIKDQQQIVNFFKSKNDIPKDFKNNMVSMLAFISPAFEWLPLYDPKRPGLRDAVLKFPCLSEALSAEFAFDGNVVAEDDVLNMRMVRNPLLVQHDIAERAAAIRSVPHPPKKGEKGAVIKYIPVRDKSKFPQVGCLNLECDTCCNKLLDPRR